MSGHRPYRSVTPALMVVASLLTGCGSSMEERVASGALIGATGGAVLGGSLGKAAVGAVVGAGAGVVVNEVDKGKGTKKRKP